MWRRREWISHCSAWALTGLATGLAQAQPKALNKTVLVLGDSLSAEYGLQRGEGWVALLEARLAAQKSPHKVRNASISGDTTAGGRARLKALLSDELPSIVVIELGGNDALRGLPLSSTRDNLREMVKQAQAAGARVLLLGMQVPPNYGGTYGRDFAALFDQVAREQRCSLVPFLLKGVADRPDVANWFQPDRIHPLAKAHPLMLELVWPVLKPLL